MPQSPQSSRTQIRRGVSVKLDCIMAGFVKNDEAYPAVNPRLRGIAHMILTWFRHAFLIAAFLAAVPFGVLETHALDGLKRTELRRVDLTGTQGTEVITSILEAAPGAGIPRHTHHGDEFLYVLEGGTIEVPGQGAYAPQNRRHIALSRAVLPMAASPWSAMRQSRRSPFMWWTRANRLWCRWSKVPPGGQASKVTRPPQIVITGCTSPSCSGSCVSRSTGITTISAIMPVLSRPLRVSLNSA